MNRHDQDLLDKQLWGVSPTPPRNKGALSLAFLAVFLAACRSAVFFLGTKTTRRR
jgi:hypothetical protein